MMLEDKGRSVAEHAKHVSDSCKRMSKFILERLMTGN